MVPVAIKYNILTQFMKWLLLWVYILNKYTLICLFFLQKGFLSLDVRLCRKERERNGWGGGESGLSCQKMLIACDPYSKTWVYFTVSFPSQRRMSEGTTRSPTFHFKFKLVCFSIGHGKIFSQCQNHFHALKLSPARPGRFLTKPVINKTESNKSEIFLSVSGPALLWSEVSSLRRKHKMHTEFW